METIQIPVAVFGFNRPDKLAAAIAQLRPLTPPEVWFFVDGPRPDHPEDAGRCAAVAALAGLFDWGCTVVVRRNVRNKGLRAQLRDGLTEFFDHHEAGLVMEDDICIAPSAAAYINAVAARIDGRTVAAASLNNFLLPGRSVHSDVVRARARPYRSHMFHCWGWVTTRAGWALYRDDIEDVCDDAFFARLERRLSGFAHLSARWKPIVAMLRNGLQSWACRYQLSLWHAEATCIVPPINLASNIGFGGDATHTLTAPDWADAWVLEDGPIALDGPIELNLDCDIEELVLTDNASPVLLCRLCDAPAQKVFTGTVLGEPRSYFECADCGSLQTSPPTWLDAAYADNISVYDTGVMLRNLANFVVTRNVIDLLGEPASLSVLEYGAGSGMLTRLLRDTGIDAHACDVHNPPTLAGNFVAATPAEFVEQCEGRRSLVVAFEVFEHFSDPAGSLAELFAMQPQALLASTDVYQGQGVDWPYLTAYSGQHVFFYSHAALELVAERHGYALVSDGNNHLFLSRASVDPALVARPLPGVQALRNSIFGAGGMNRFVGHYNTVGGVMADHNRLVARLPAPAAPLPPRVFLSRPPGGVLYVDCIFYQMASTGIAKLWNEVFRVWAERYRDRVVLLDRGGEIETHGLRREKLGRFDFQDVASGVRNLTWYLMRQGANALLSTYYTFCEHLPTRAVIYDMIPEVLGYTGAEWDLKRQYLQRAESAFSISRTTHEAVQRFHSHLVGRSDYELAGISPVFRPVPAETRAAIRTSLDVRRRLLFLLPCALGGYKDGITALNAVALRPEVEDIEVICTVPVENPDAIAALFPRIRLRFMRFATDRDYAQLVAAADLVLWPSRIEGIGFPPVEAIASGTRMVCARTDVNLEVYGEDAVYAEPGNPASFAEAMARALSGPLSPRLSGRVAAIRDYEDFALRLFDFGLHGKIEPPPMPPVPTQQALQETTA